MKVYFTILFIFFSTYFILGSEFVINDDFCSANIGKHVYYLEDQNLDYSYPEIISGHINYLFKKSDKDILYFGYKESNYWVMFTLKNNTQQEKELFIDIAYPLLHKVQLLSLDENNIIDIQTSGNSIPFNKREIKESTNLFKILLNSQQEKTFYVLIQSKGVDLTIPIKISTSDSYIQWSKRLHLFNGFYYGLLVLMILINLFYFINLKDKAYLYYILYVLSLSLYLLTRDGLSFQYLWPNSPVWARNADISFALSGITFMGLFVQNTLLTKRHLPILHNILNVLIFFIVVIFFISLFFKPLYSIGNYTVLPASIVVISIAFLSLKFNISIVKYFLIGVCFLAAGLFILVLKNFGLIDYYTGEVGIKVGSSLDIIVLSFGLTVRFKEMFKKSQDMAIENLKKLNRLKDKINLKLENEVNKRTSKLKEQNQQIALSFKAIQKQKDEIQSQKELLEISNLELEQLSLVARETDNAIAIFNHKYDLEWLNRGFLKLFEFTFSELIEKRGTTLKKISNNPDIDNIIKKVIQTKKSVVYNSQSNIKSGKIWVRTTLTPIFDKNGNLEKLIAIDSDITKLIIAEQEIKQREEEIRAQRDEIEKQNKNMEQAYIKVKESSKLKEIFLANTSHEIRTPLNGIIGFTNLLLNTSLSAKQLSYLQNIKVSGDNLLVVIDDILDFSKIEAGKLNLEIVNFDLRKVFIQILKSFNDKIEEKSLFIHNSFDSKIPAVLLGDPVRINQIFSNLIGNAIKFTPSKGIINIYTKVTTETKKNITIKFDISDNGIGIDENNLKSIFKSFTQAKSDTTRKYGGTGLGLSIVKRLIKLLSGNIYVESKVNQGSTFTIVLTFKKTTLNIIPDTNQKNTDLGECHPEKIRILLVEDNEINQELAVDSIKQWYSKTVIDVAQNGQVAIDLFHKQHYNIVLMDIQMPIMDGYDTTVFIRNQFPKPICDTPIVAMTAHALNHEKEKCARIGMNDYISKPFMPEKLYSVLKMWTCYKVIKLIKEGKSFNIKDIKCTSNTAKAIIPEIPSINIDFDFKEVDISKLISIYKSDINKIKKILGLYIMTIPDELNNLSTQIQNHNWEMVKPKAHTLKTKMGYLGLTQSQENMKNIELNALESPNFKAFSKLFEFVKNQWNKAEKEINQFINT